MSAQRVRVQRHPDMFELLKVQVLSYVHGDEPTWLTVTTYDEMSNGFATSSARSFQMSLSRTFPYHLYGEDKLTA